MSRPRIDDRSLTRAAQLQSRGREEAVKIVPKQDDNRSLARAAQLQSRDREGAVNIVRKQGTIASRLRIDDRSLACAARNPGIGAARVSKRVCGAAR